MYFSKEIITPTVQPSCTGNVFYYLAKRREMWGEKNNEREKGEKSLVYEEKEMAQHMVYVTGHFHSRKKVERTGKVEIVP